VSVSYFAKESDACKFLDLGTNSIIEARDAEFFKDKFIKDKVLLPKDIPKNAEKFRAPDEQVRVCYLGSNAWLEMEDGFREMPSKENIFVVMHRGAINSGGIRVFGSKLTVFLFQKCKHKDINRFHSFR